MGQIIGKWTEGGWMVLISFAILALTAHALLLSPLGYREPRQIHRIVRKKARVQGAMASIVEWQSLKMQEYRYQLLTGISRFWALFGVIRPVRYDPPVEAGIMTTPSMSITRKHPPSWRPTWIQIQTLLRNPEPDNPIPEPRYPAEDIIRCPPLILNISVEEFWGLRKNARIERATCYT
jgi:hypothetical protein